MPKKEILKLCEKSIKDRLGNLNDIPYELANTVANIHYKFIELSTDMKKKRTENSDNWIPTGVIEELEKNHDIFKATEKFEEKFLTITCHYEDINAMIDNLRRIDRDRQQRVYELAVEFYLDWFKYEIKYLDKKPRLIRGIERKMKRRKVDEMPNLVDLLDI